MKRNINKLLFVAVLGVFILGFSTVSYAATEVEFWYPLGGSNGEVFRSMVEGFNDSHNGIEINAIYQGGYGDTARKVINSLASDNLPDGGLIPAAPLFTGREGNYLVQKYINGPNGLDTSDFFSVLWDYNKYNGTISSLPFNNSTPILYYNKELMKDAGLDPSSPPSTWDELLQMARKINDQLSGVMPINIHDTDWLFKAFILQAGGRIMNNDASAPRFNSCAGIQAMNLYKTLINENLMPKGQHGDQPLNTFVAGRLAFMLATTGYVSNALEGADFEFGTDMLPKKNYRGATVGGAALTMFPSTEEKQQATWEFLKWLISPENIVRWSMKTGYIPIRKSVAQSEMMQQFWEKNPQYKAGFNQLEYAETYEHFWEMGTMDDILHEAIEKVEYGQLTPTKALAEAENRLVQEMEATE